MKVPIYPYSDVIDPDGNQKEKCDEWYSNRLEIFKKLSILDDGTSNYLYPINFFREKTSYYQVLYWLDIQNPTVEEIANLSEKEKLLFLLSYSSTLSKLHDKTNLVHGDINPNNVLLVLREHGKGDIIIKGFDETFFSKEPLCPEYINCAEEYRSPELAAYVITNTQKESKRYSELREKMTCAIDVFASGILFHEFWAGCRPKFESALTSDKSFYKAVVAGEKYEYDDRIPLWLRALIDDMVQRDPEKRPTMNEVCVAIKAEKYDKKNPWQNKGDDVTDDSSQPVIDSSELNKLILSIPNNLDELEPQTVVTKINMMRDYIQQNLGSMTQEQVNILTERLALEIRSLKNPAEGWFN